MVNFLLHIFYHNKKNKVDGLSITFLSLPDDLL